MNCLETEQLARLALDLDPQSDWKVHVERCPDCRRGMERMAALCAELSHVHGAIGARATSGRADLMAALAGATVKRINRRRPWIVAATAAAALCIAAALVGGGATGGGNWLLGLLSPRENTMKYLLLIVNAEDDFQRLNKAEQQRVIDGMNAFGDDLKRENKFVSCGGLAPSSEAKSVRKEGQERVVANGPIFRIPQGNQLVTGFFVIQTKSIDEAVAWAKKMPIISGSVEIRPIAAE
jgi:hypothetical protein